jgi:hypothetical protein
LKVEFDSQADTGVQVNISNATFSQTYAGFELHADVEYDDETGEPYNGTTTCVWGYELPYEFVCVLEAPAYWEGNIPDLGVSKYNLTLNLTDEAGQADVVARTLFVYPPVNVTFDITDPLFEAPLGPNRTVGIALGPFPDEIYWDGDVVGSRQITLPNVSYFVPEHNVSAHVWLIKFFPLPEIYFIPYPLPEFIPYPLLEPAVVVLFTNGSIESSMQVVSQHVMSRSYADGKILYSVYANRPSWTYENSKFEGLYNLTQLGVHRPDKATLYTCREWDFSSPRCKTSWLTVPLIWNYSSDEFLWLSAMGDQNEAFALGEPQFCGDGYCNPALGETCLACAADCGACPPPVFFAPPPRYVYDFSVSLPALLELYPNESRQFNLTVKNTANGTLTDLIVDVVSEPDCRCTIAIEPTGLDLLRPGKSASFVVTIPAGITPGTYTLRFNVSSDQLSKERSVALRVRELPPPPTQAEAESAMLAAEQAIEKGRAIGLNVTEAEHLLTQAKAAFARGEYVRARELAEQARAAAEMAPPPPKPMDWLPWLIIAALVGIGGLGGLFLFRLWRRPRELTWEELYRKWARSSRSSQD